MSKKKPPLEIVPPAGFIRLRGVRQNNLKGIDLDIPLGRLNVISGPSGSGKSSLAFDTIYAEGQRRYVETFSPYTRQFLDRMDKPKVDEIRGIPPAIAIQQSNSVKSTRSTVGTMTEINDYLKVLMPRIVEGFCPSCQRQIRPESAATVIEHAFAELAGANVVVTFDVPAPPGTKPADFFQFLQQQGYLRVWLDGTVRRTDAPAEVKRLPALVPVIQDRVTVDAENRSRLAEAVETALRFGKGKVSLVESVTLVAHPFSTGWHCAHCDIEIKPPTPSLFSFNHPLGACPECRGFGRVIGIDLQRAVPDRRLCLMDRAVKPFQGERGEQCQKDLMRFAEREEIDVLAPFDELSKRDRDWVLKGEDPKLSGLELWENGRWYGVRGFFEWLETKTYKMHVRVFLARYRSYTPCPSCEGGRYQPATMNFRAAGKTLPELMQMPVGRLADLIESFAPRMSADPTGQMLHGEVVSRLRYLVEVGLGYLTVDRPTKTLSGGEVERVNLTACLGASLVNTLFVLDEPSVGLHPRDVGRLIRVMKELRDKGNTLVVVEHEEAVLRSADNMIEIGPGRGASGGELVYSGTLPALLRNGTGSLTADYLTGRKSIPVPKQRRQPSGWIKINHAAQNNLKNIDVELPLGVLACVTGVSGSGKSTLVHEVLYRNLQQSHGHTLEEEAGRCRGVSGAHKIDEVVMVDQSPLARSPRSSPALYLGVFDAIREMFSLQPQASAQGMTSSTFSFNSGNGRCERCSGMGAEKIEMQFLSDIFVQCPECEGRRYQDHVLAVKVDGCSIHDVLEMTVDAAIGFFQAREMRKVVTPLTVLQEVGLGYLRMGQPLNVLSGGESQRLKLVSHLTGKAKENNLLIFDEPTTGLHFDDVALLLKAFDRLVRQGNSLVVIEHNLEVIKCADYVIDLGPEAGEEGGELVAAGTPEEVAGNERSHTGRYLRQVLSTRKVPEEGWGIRSESSLYNLAEEENSVLRLAEQPPNGKSNGFSVIPETLDGIRIHGAREHNLKDISLTIPRDQMVVVTGLSGSGKSTLAFDLVFAEGQRRFLDSMSPYARQFMEQLEKPEVDLIVGLPPTVAIEQRVTRGGGKSTVATVTEVYHFMRLLFAKAGTQFCPKCDLAVEAQTVAAVIRQAEALAEKGSVRVLAPLIKARKGFHTDVAKWAGRQGFETLLVDGKFVAVAGFEKLERFREHTIDVLVGEATEPAEIKKLVTQGLKVGRGTARLLDASDRSTILSTERSCPGCGQSFEELDPRLFSYNSPHGWCPECRGFGEVWKVTENPRAETELEREMEAERQHAWLDPDSAKECPACHGARINEVAQHVRIADTSIDLVAARSVREAARFFDGLKLRGRQKLISDDVLVEIGQRLHFMTTVGLDYLALDRSAKTLSGGESQRIRLAAQLGSNLSGVLYVLDEPTIGLHPRDNRQLLDTLEALKKKGNSLLVVEHDEDTMARADQIIDLGPGAGMHGGEVVAQGTLAEIRKVEGSATARCLNHPMRHPSRGQRRPLAEVAEWIEVKGARANNLKDVDARLPLGRLTVLSGISGSGKSSLMRGVVQPAVSEAISRQRKRKKTKADPWDEVLGAKAIEAVYEVDQSPIGKTSRSTPATYIKVFDEIRKVFAQIPLARMRGYTASRFSFNAEGGRCETCKGQGVIKIEMNFLPPSYIPCSDCHGRRYNAATLEVEYDGKSIGDVMDMTLEQAAEFFQPHPKIRRPLGLLVDTGLGYLKLGQPSPTLSGGEAQRLKLVSELTRGVGRDENTRMRRGVSKSILYLLEEPTIGLHMADVERLLDVLHRLVDEGHTVVVIEHNLTLIADADYVIDIGPEAGGAGGQVVAHGTPEQVAKSKTSRTAPFIREILAR